MPRCPYDGVFLVRVEETLLLQCPLCLHYFKLKNGKPYPPQGFLEMPLEPLPLRVSKIKPQPMPVRTGATSPTDQLFQQYLKEVWGIDYEEYVDMEDRVKKLIRKDFHNWRKGETK